MILNTKSDCCQDFSVCECYELAKNIPSPSGKDRMHDGIKDGSHIELSMF